MKILIVSQYFWPEKFRINDLVLELKDRGHEIVVLTGLPNYPQGSFFKGYRFKYMVDNYLGVKIYRVPILPRGKYGFTILLNYLSFVITGCVFAIFHNERFDKLFAVNFSPITAVYPAIIFKWRYRIPLFIWVQDLWPESVSAGGKIKSVFLLKLLDLMVRHIYQNANVIFVQSKAFVHSITKKSIPSSKIVYMPNWAEDLFLSHQIIDSSVFKSVIPEGFKIMFAGNIGEAQDFESILKAAIIAKRNPNIKWLIIGDGRKKDWLRSEIQKRGLENTIFLLGSFPVEDMPNFFVHADI